MIYFDNNATTPLSPEAREAWLKAVEQFPANPSSPHRLGSRAGAALAQAREKLARILGCDGLDLVWTSGATESNNTVLHHFARVLPPDKEIWVSAIEHPCVLIPAQHYFGKRVRRIPVTQEGIVDSEWIHREIFSGKPGLIAVMAANNETGLLQPWREISKLCRKHEVPFFCDAAQWIGKMPATGIGQCDWVSGCAHKFGGPKGIGFLKCARMVTPLILGGEQEDGRRSGTENVASVLSMVAALAHCESLLAKDEQDERTRWREKFESTIAEHVAGCAVIGKAQPRLWNTIAMLMPQADCQQRWVVKLDKAGFPVSTGSACSSGKEKPSHVLNAIGYSSDDSSRMLRFSSGWQTTKQDWNQLADAVVNVNIAMK